MRHRIIGLVVMLLAAGCVTAGTGEHRGGDRRVLTLEEIEASTESTAYEIIQMQRPGWLRARPTTLRNPDPVRVYIDGSRKSSLEELKLLSKQDLQELRFYDAASAQMQFGLNNTNGAIAVTTRRR